MSSIATIDNRSLDASPPPRRAADANSLASTLESRLARIEAGIYRWPAGQGLSPMERHAAMAMIEEADRKLGRLVPDDGGALVENVSEQVYASFKARDPKTTEQAIYDGFLIALPGRAAAAVNEAVRRIIRSEAPPKYSRTFVPTAGELAELSIAIEQEWTLGRDRLRRLLAIEEQPAGRPEPELTPEGKSQLERAKARLRQMRAAVTRKRSSYDPVDATRD